MVSKSNASRGLLLLVAPCAFRYPRGNGLRAGSRDRNAALVRGARHKGKDHSHGLHFLDDPVKNGCRDHRAIVRGFGNSVRAELCGNRRAAKGVCHKCAAIFHAVQRIGFVPLFTACGGRGGREGADNRAAASALRNGIQKVVALFDGGHQPRPLGFQVVHFGFKRGQLLRGQLRTSLLDLVRNRGKAGFNFL